MLKIIGAAVIVVFAIAVLLAFTGRKSVHAEVTISSPPTAVWAVITDAESYAEWNPILISASGEFKAGGSISYQMKIGDSDPSPVAPTIRKMVENEILNQFGGYPGILTFDHYWRLEPLSEGTRVTQEEYYRGLGVWFWDPGVVEMQYQLGLDALRQRLERADQPAR